MTALNRVSSLIETLAGFYDDAQESFAVKDAFVMHALLAAGNFVSTAQKSLDTLHERCDLTLLPEVSQARGLEDVAALHAGAADMPSASEAVSEAEFDSRYGFAATLGSALGYSEPASAPNGAFTAPVMAEAPAAVEPPPAPVAREAAQPAARENVRDEEFAQSYLELLRKLTAAEIFAVEQQALAPPGTQHQLLPLLRALREDFQKLHSAA